MLAAHPETERGSQYRNDTSHSNDGKLPADSWSSPLPTVLTYDQVVHLIRRKLQYQEPQDRLRQMFRAMDSEGRLNVEADAAANDMWSVLQC
jgi:hypothetical protein